MNGIMNFLQDGYFSIILAILIPVAIVLSYLGVYVLGRYHGPGDGDGQISDELKRELQGFYEAVRTAFRSEARSIAENASASKATMDFEPLPERAGPNTDPLPSIASVTKLADGKIVITDSNGLTREYPSIEKARIDWGVELDSHYAVVHA